MEQKLVRVPFEENLAKEITNGTKEGRIVTRDGRSVRVMCWDVKDKFRPILALIMDSEEEKDYTYFIDGMYYGKRESEKDLMLEIPEYMTFKDGDIIAFGDIYTFIGIFKSAWTYNESHSDYVVLSHDNRLMFDGDAWTYQNARKATEEEKQRLIVALKASKSPRVKEYLKRFFGIEEKKEYEFKPKDWVLCKSGDEWCLCRFSHKTMRFDGILMFVAVGGLAYEKCIPYNEQTANLIGKTEDWEG